MITYPRQRGGTDRGCTAVYWLRMPLLWPYINLYLLESGTGWTIIDTGIRGPETRSLWQQITDTHLKGKPLSNPCTHMHPDHTGQAGFLS